MVGPACGRSSNHGGTGGSPIPFVASCRQKSHTVLARDFAHLIGFFDPVVRIPGIQSYVVMSLAAGGNLVMEKVPEVLELAARERDVAPECRTLLAGRPCHRHTDK